MHNIWQVDAKEQLVLANGSHACYLTITDERSGAWIEGIAFPCFMISQVPLEEVRAALVSVFEKWGKPGSLRVDNGAPLGNPRMSSISALPLWLISMDVDMIWNKPHSPQSNGKVERMQGTSSRWVVIKNCKDIQELQHRLNQESTIQRTKLPIKRLKNQTILEAFPEILMTKRPYNEADFDEKRAHQLIAKAVYNRKSDKHGFVRLYGQDYKLTTAHGRKSIQISLDAKELVWKFFDQKKLIAERPALHLIGVRIKNLTACQRTS